MLKIRNAVIETHVDGTQDAGINAAVVSNTTQQKLRICLVCPAPPSTRDAFTAMMGTCLDRDQVIQLRDTLNQFIGAEQQKGKPCYYVDPEIA